MIIDIHNHADYHGRSAEAMVKNMDECGIDLTVLLSWEAPETEVDPRIKRAFSPFSPMPVPFSRCVEYKKAAPDRFLLGYCPDPRLPDSIERLIAVNNLYHPAMCGELKFRMMYDNPDAIRFYQAAGKLGLPVLMHFDYPQPCGTVYPWNDFWYGGDIDVLERVLKLCPETNFIGHAAGFWSHISNDDQGKTIYYPKGKVIPGGRLEQLLEQYPNLYCDLSAGSGNNALRRDPEFGRQFLIKWQDRLMFGRDYFDNVHREFIEGADLPEEVKSKIYEGNARRILKI